MRIVSVHSGPVSILIFCAIPKVHLSTHLPIYLHNHTCGSKTASDAQLSVHGAVYPTCTRAPRGLLVGLSWQSALAAAARVCLYHDRMASAVLPS